LLFGFCAIQIGFTQSVEVRMAGRRLDFEIDETLDAALVTARAGVPSLIEAFRRMGAGAKIDDLVKIKQRSRGLLSSQMAESFFALWASGGERCEDLDRLRQDAALNALIGYDLPAAQTGRDFLAAFHEDDLPLLHEGKSTVPIETAPLVGLAAANREMILDLQSRKPVRTATLDVDATVIVSSKRAARFTYEGDRGYQPVLVVWAEQDVIIADEFRDGNVPASVGNARVIEKALAALPGKFDAVYVRGDSALYQHDAMRLMDARGVGYAISAVLSGPLKTAILALPEAAWRIDRAEGERFVREWAQVDFVPDDRIYKKDHDAPRRYLAVRIRSIQGDLLGDSEEVFLHRHQPR
jgi:hypothetical protein